MMNLDDIAKRIKEPHLCSSTDIEHFHQLSDKYPFAQAFSILYLKALSTNNDVRFDDELHLHAYKITDRMRLYELVHEKENGTISTTITETEVINSEKIETHSIYEDIVSEVELPDLLATETQSEAKEKTTLDLITEGELIDQPVVELNTIEEIIIPEELNLKSSEIDEPATESTSEASNTIKPIKETILPFSLTEENNEPEILVVGNELILEEIDETEFTPDFSIEFDDITIENNSEDEEHSTAQSENESETSLHSKVEVIPEVESKTVNSFELKTNGLEIDMLSHAVASNYTLEPIEEKDKIEIEDKIEDKIEIEAEIGKEITIEKNTNSAGKKAFSSWLKSNRNEKPVQAESESKTKIDYLVDQFLKEEPSISRPQKEVKQETPNQITGTDQSENLEEKPKTEFFSPLKKAKKSLDENSLPVSETLAKIFVAQGNFPKAIYAYQQLIVIYPEKKIFFANQIEELTKKLNT